MSREATRKPPTWFWVVSGVSLVWNLMGLMAFVMQVTITPEALAAMPEAERTLYETVPAWATGAFAVAVIAGTLGCIILLLRKRLASSLFILSLVGVLLQNFNSFALSDTMAVYGPTIVIMPLLVLVIAVLLVWFSRMATSRGWLS